MKNILKKLSLIATISFTLGNIAPVFAQEGPISVVSREDGSGTRGAFVEIVKVETEDGDDNTTLSAVIQNSTNGVMQTVANDPSSVGYISLGSLDDSIKAVKVDGVEASAENVKSGEYKLARPFNLAWNKEKGLSDVAQDFLDYIHSTQGQKIVEERGFISSAKDKTQEYKTKELKGTVEVVGSTSVTPAIEVLAEEYKKINPKVTINITSNGSSAGMEAAINGAADLGMASRELSEDESSKLDQDAIALDGIAVIVNKENKLDNLTLDQIRKIFLGEIEDWSEIK